MRIYSAIVPKTATYGVYTECKLSYYRQVMQDYVFPILEIEQDRRLWTPAERRACASFLRWCKTLRKRFVYECGAYTVSNLNEGTVAVFVACHAYEGGAVSCVPDFTS